MIFQDQLSALLKTAEVLQIKGLAEVANESAAEQPTETDNMNNRQAEIIENVRAPPPTLASPPMKRRRRRPSNEAPRPTAEPVCIVLYFMFCYLNILVTYLSLLFSSPT